jgi:hypothetical protein
MTVRVVAILFGQWQNRLHNIITKLGYHISGHKNCIDDIQIPSFQTVSCVARTVDDLRCPIQYSIYIYWEFYNVFPECIVVPGMWLARLQCIPWIHCNNVYSIYGRLAHVLCSRAPSRYSYHLQSWSLAWLVMSIRLKFAAVLRHCLLKFTPLFLLPSD